MKPMLTWYGGKQRIVQHIIPLIPPHNTYVEPFFGGGAVLFAKPQSISSREVVNDLNAHLVTFYRVMQDAEKMEELLERLQYTPFSIAEYYKAKHILEDESPVYDEVTIAWAMFTAVYQSFGCNVNSGWAKDRKGTRCISSTFINKHRHLDQAANRFINVELWNEDALSLIPYFDTPNTFFYVDPPYINTDQGHYSGFTVEMYQELLKHLSGIQGRFILSGYPNDYADAYGWRMIDIDTTMSICNNKEGVDKARVERLWMNFDPPAQQSLFA